jgi:hypothetical protein
VLLCKLHHDNYGRRLTRDAITAALGSGKQKIVAFKDANTIAEVPGVMIEVVIPDSGETTRFFFTKTHAEYWLSN